MNSLGRPPLWPETNRSKESKRVGREKEKVRGKPENSKE